jgi:iron-sulfur cluster assembly accessory protein
MLPASIDWHVGLELEMSNDTALPIQFTDAAANKVKALIADEENPNLRLRVYITGGGCSGFQYGFTFDDKMNEGDLTIEKQGVELIVDPMSLQYLVGGCVDYIEGLEGSRFVVTNPNAKTTCGCGSSFSI